MFRRKALERFAFCIGGCRAGEFAAGHCDAGVGQAQIFHGAVLDRAHAFLQGRVLHGDAFHAAIGAACLLAFTIHQVVVAPIGSGNESAGHIGYMNAFACNHRGALIGSQIAVGVVIDAPRPAIMIVNRDPGVPANWMTGAGGMRLYHGMIQGVIRQ